MISAAELLRDMHDGREYPAAARRVMDELRRDGENRLVVVFAGERMDAKVDVVRALYASEQRFFTFMFASIRAEMIDHAARQLEATAEARRDAARVEQLRLDVAAETAAASGAASSYVMSHPNAAGIQFNCDLACHQAIGVARGLNLWDGS